MSVKATRVISLEHALHGIDLVLTCVDGLGCAQFWGNGVHARVLHERLDSSKPFSVRTFTVNTAAIDTASLGERDWFNDGIAQRDNSGTLQDRHAPTHWQARAFRECRTGSWLQLEFTTSQGVNYATIHGFGEPVAAQGVK